jgi:hypothetical protein
MSMAPMTRHALVERASNISRRGASSISPLGSMNLFTTHGHLQACRLAERKRTPTEIAHQLISMRLAQMAP